MKNFILRLLVFLLMFSVATGFSQKKQLKKIWQTEKILKVPESVLFHKDSKTLYVSTIDGAPTDKDGKGGITKLTTDGKVDSLNWISGLNAPKGMGIFNDMLYVSDIDEVVAIDIKTSAIVLRIPIEGAKFLNDIAIDPKGIVFVSDMRKGTVHRIENGQPELYMENIEGVNGLCMAGDELYLVAKGILWKARGKTELLMIAEGMDESTDGVEMTKEKNFIISSWAGLIYYVDANTGKVQQLIDLRPQKLNTADIGFDPQQEIIYVPTFSGNRVIAYQLK